MRGSIGSRFVAAIVLALVAGCSFAYNGVAAANYALKWSANTGEAFNSNEYKRFDNDCTNFVSQSLLAGGLPQISSANVSYMPSGVGAKLNIGLPEGYFVYDINQWYYQSGDMSENPTRSWSWASVKGLYAHLMSRPEGFVDVGSDVSKLLIGDVIFLEKSDTGIYHAMMVTGTAPLRISAHTSDRNNYEFSNFKFGAETKIKGVRITPDLPIDSVDFSISNASPKLGEVVTFTPKASSPNGYIKNYSWSFGDRGAGISMPDSSSVNYTYSNSGTYEITLIVTDPIGKIEEVVKTVVVTDIGCVGQWRSVTYLFGETESTRQLCGTGFSGDKLLSHQCLAGGVWSDLIVQENCTPNPIPTCNGIWSSMQYGVGEKEAKSSSCTGGQIGSIVDSHTCLAGPVWGQISTVSTCACPSGQSLINGVCSAPPVMCKGTWTSQSYVIGAVEEKFDNTCPVGTTGKVRSYHTCQSGGVWSATANSDNCTAVLLPPGSPRVASVSGGMKITWNTASGATGYNVYRDGVRTATVSGGLTSSVLDTGVSNGVSYCYAVEASSTYTTPPTISERVSAGCATYSSGPPALLAPANVSASQISGGGLRITWSQSTGADGYVLTRQNDNNEWNLSSSTTSYDDFGVTPGISYSYVVQAKRGAELSPQSNQGNAMAPYVPVNGACGSAHNVAVRQIPSTNLCSSGNPSGVSGSGPWSWTCSGVNGGTTASCSAPLAPPVSPVVNGFAPKFGARGSTTVVAVTGTGLPDTLALAIANATCTNRGTFSSTTTQQFDCVIPSGAPIGMALVTVKDRPGGTVLFQPSLSQGFDIR